MKQNIKIAFFDIDGTLVSNNIISSDLIDRVPESTKLAIRQLKDNGIIPVIATGRGKAVILSFAESLGITSYISANGLSLVYEGEKIYDQFLDTQTVKNIVEYLSETEDIGVLFESSEGYVLCRDDYKKGRSFGAIPEFNPDNFGKYGVYEILVVGDDLRTRLKFNMEGLKGKMVAPVAMNILPENVSKATAIESLLQRLDIDRSEAIAFGDEENDIEMFQTTGFAVAMGNGVDELKKLATYITDDVDHDGIYNACKYYRLI